MTIHLRYIGKKERYTEHLYGTGVIWLGKGDVCPLDNQVGAKLLQHADVFELATKEEYDALNGAPAGVIAKLAGESEPPKEKREPTLVEEKDDERDARIHQVNLSNMTKEQLREYATRQFNKDYPTEMPFAELRKAVTELRKAAGILGNT